MKSNNIKLAKLVLQLSFNNNYSSPNIKKGVLAYSNVKV